ncbi:MAG: GTPase [Planctomycetota bacterium]|nr:GTPase [Planctomycetota bacterium]
MEEVIYALASPPPPATLVLLRLDGSGSANCIKSLFSTEDVPLVPRSPCIAELTWDSQALAVPSLVVLWKQGASWTGNEGVEFYLPGSAPIVDGIFERLEAAGARLAQPGEFTRRAFMNGRIDLSRAESVAALIEAEDRASLAAARRVLEGELARGIGSAADLLLDVIALLEAGLDFSEQEVESPGPEVVGNLLQPILADLDHLLSRRQKTFSPEGIPRVLLWGRANAGKSSLFNALLGKDQAIASAEAGTTTDAVRGILSEGNLQLEILDLPGLRVAQGEVETMALERAEELLEGDDPILWVIDSSRGEQQIQSEAAEIPASIQPRLRPVLTQIDRISPTDLQIYPDAARVSSITGEGIDRLRTEILRWTSVVAGQERADSIRFTRRQWRLLDECRQSLCEAIEDANAGPELLVSDLRAALTLLQEVTGEATPEDVLDRIFARFCLGK